MQKIPKVSIITTCYNANQLIRRTIESVLTQDYPSIEYIIVDADSTDGTKETIESLLSDQMLYISEPDQGLYEGLNKGLTLTTGDYLLFLHAGDSLYDTQTLSRLISMGNGMDFIFGKPLVILKDGSETTWHKHLMNPQNLTKNDFLYGMVVCHQAMLVRKNIVPSFNPKYQVASDLDWVIRVLSNTNKIQYTDLFVCHYYRGGISDQRRHRALFERFLILYRHFGISTAIKAHWKIGGELARKALSIVVTSISFLL